MVLQYAFKGAIMMFNKVFTSFIISGLLACTLLFISSCGDADSITTPRDIDTLIKTQPTIIKTITISPSSVFFYINGVNNRLAPTQGNNIEAVQYSDLTWGVRLNLFVSNIAIVQQLEIDSFSMRATDIKAGKAPTVLTNTISSGKDYASRIVLRRPGVNNFVIEPAMYSGTMNAPTIECNYSNGELLTQLHYSSNGIPAIESQVGQGVSVLMEIRINVE